jgi:hypothetical protein
MPVLPGIILPRRQRRSTGHDTDTAAPCAPPDPKSRPAPLDGVNRRSEGAMHIYINMNDVMNHATVTEDRDAVDGNDWQRGLEALASRFGPDAPQRGRLEINAHGMPASIHLRPYVSFDNVAQFAALICRLLLPGSVIEILSCHVACIPLGALREIADPAMADRLTAFAKDSRAVRRHVVRADDPMPASAFGGPELVRFAEMAAARLPPGTPEDVTANGPLFCTQLADATGCRVRAAMFAQVEEQEVTGNRAYRTPFGNWDGHVFDFLPGRKVTYAGYNLPRPVFRTHDQHGDGPLRFG